MNKKWSPVLYHMMASSRGGWRLTRASYEMSFPLRKHGQFSSPGLPVSGIELAVSRRLGECFSVVPFGSCLDMRFQKMFLFRDGNAVFVWMRGKIDQKMLLIFICIFNSYTFINKDCWLFYSSSSSWNVKFLKCHCIYSYWSFWEVLRT